MAPCWLARQTLQSSTGLVAVQRIPPSIGLDLDSAFVRDEMAGNLVIFQVHSDVLVHYWLFAMSVEGEFILRH